MYEMHWHHAIHQMLLGSIPDPLLHGSPFQCPSQLPRAQSTGQNASKVSVKHCDMELCLKTKHFINDFFLMFSRAN